MKLHIFDAKHKINAYNKKLFPSNDRVLIWSWPPVKFMTSRETQEYFKSFLFVYHVVKEVVGQSLVLAVHFLLVPVKTGTLRNLRSGQN